MVTIPSSWSNLISVQAKRYFCGGMMMVTLNCLVSLLIEMRRISEINSYKHIAHKHTLVVMTLTPRGSEKEELLGTLNQKLQVTY